MGNQRRWDLHMRLPLLVNESTLAHFFFQLVCSFVLVCFPPLKTPLRRIVNEVFGNKVFASTRYWNCVLHLLSLHSLSDTTHASRLWNIHFYDSFVLVADGINFVLLWSCGHQIAIWAREVCLL